MNPVVKYFSAEKMWCTGGAMIAILSIGIALLFFLRIKQPLQTGMAWPFLILGFIFFVICLSVALRSGADASRVSLWVDTSKENLTSQELPRMIGVMRNFTIIISLEVVFVLVSITCLFAMNLSTLTRGVMLGLLIQAGWLLIFDMFARSRGADYLSYLKSVAPV
jgi:hypothetical protein